MSEIDLVLINPASLTEKKSFFKRDLNELLEKYPPLGLGYLASSCKQKGYKVAIIDLDVEHLSMDVLIKKVASLKPRLIGVSCLSPLVSIAVGITRDIKKSFDIPIVMGGAHTNIDPESLLKEDSIDFLIRGAGETGIVQLMDYLTSGNIELKDVDNISYKKDGNIFHKPLSEIKEHLDEYPFPDRSLFKNSRYYNPFSLGTKFISIITSRGCVYNCTFCNPIYKKLRKRSVQNVIDEIKKEMRERKTHNFEIFDETFNFPPEWVMEFCDRVIESKLKISFRIRCRPDFIVSEEMTKKLKRAGCYLVSMGIESSNDKTLKFYNKGYNTKQTRNAIRLLKKANLKIQGYFVTGSPSDSKQEMLDTIDFAVKSGIDFATFAILTPYPGTKLYDIVQEQGLWKDQNKLNYEDQIGVVVPLIKHPELSKNEVKKMQRRAYLKFYLRWQTIPNLIRLLWFNPFYPYNVLRCQLK